MRHCFFTIILLVIWVFACKENNPARPPCEASNPTFPEDTSFVSTPLVIPTQLLEDKLNRAIQRDILNDFSPEKKGRLKLKITRLGDIQVRWKDNVATYQTPLLVLVEQQIIPKKMLPLPKPLALKTEFSLQLVFETTVNIGADWKLQPKTRFVSFAWLSKVKALGGLIDLEKMVERRLRRQMPAILENMDEAIRANVHLERAIEKVWRNIQKPMLINRKSELVWLKINPIRFEMGTISTDSGNLLIHGRLLATTQTLVGDAPEYVIDSTLPPLVKRPSLPNEAYVYLLSETPFSDLNDLVDRKLAGKNFEIPGHRLKVKSAKIWGCGPNLVLQLSVRGDLKGDIYFQGRPRYERDSQRIVIENFDFEVETEEMLFASADWLLHGMFKEQVEATLSIELAEQIAKIPEKITAGIERGRAGKKIDLSIEHWDFRPQQIWVRPTDIATLVIVNARVRVELEKI